MGVSIMFSISLLLLIPIAVSSSPVSLVSQAESLKSILRVVDRDPTYTAALARVGVRTYRCIDDIDDAIDDAIDDDIDDTKDAFILSKVDNFITKYNTAILSYSKNRFSNSLITNTVSPIMMSDLAQLCRDIGGRPAAVFRNDRTFLPRIAGNVGVSSSPVSLVSQSESLKSILRAIDRDPTYAGALARVGVRTYRCIDDIDDAIDDAIDDDIDDAKDAVILYKVINFITKYRTT